MTPAEKKFSELETSLMRAQCLVRVLRDISESGPDGVDPVLWGGIYIIIGEAETALDAAAASWTAAHALAVSQ